MKERRWPWFVSGILLVFSGLSAAAAVYLYWLPCPHVVMSQGPFGNLAGHPAEEISQSCGEVLSGATTLPVPPLTAVIDLTATALAGLAWLVLLSFASWTRRERRLGSPLAAAIAAQVAVLAVSAAAWPGEAIDTTLGFLKLVTDVAMFVALTSVLVSERSRRQILLGCLALWGVAQSGFVAALVDYFIMFDWTGRYWEDAPPGTGYPAAIASVVAGLSIMVLVAVDRSGRTGSATLDGEKELSHAG